MLHETCPKSAFLWKIMYILAQIKLSIIFPSCHNCCSYSQGWVLLSSGVRLAIASLDTCTTTFYSSSPSNIDISLALSSNPFSLPLVFPHLTDALFPEDAKLATLCNRCAFPDSGIHAFNLCFLPPHYPLINVSLISLPSLFPFHAMVGAERCLSKINDLHCVLHSYFCSGINHLLWLLRLVIIKFADNELRQNSFLNLTMLLRSAPLYNLMI